MIDESEISFQNSTMHLAEVMRFRGESIAEWSTKLGILENRIEKGDGFVLTVTDFELDPEFLRKLRCLNVSRYEETVEPNANFRTDVILPLLNREELVRLLPDKLVLNSLKTIWNLSNADIESTTEAFVFLRWLMEKQTGLSLNQRLHQTIDFNELFYESYTPEGDVFELLSHCELQPTDFSGIFARWKDEPNDWLRFTTANIMVDINEWKHLPSDKEFQQHTTEMFTCYANLLKRWTGRFWKISK